MLPADLIILLVAIPLAAGILSTLFRDWVEAQRLIGVVALVSCLGLAIHWMVFAASGDFIVTQVGGWPAPYGISVVFDALAGVLIIAANAVALACYLHAFGSLKPGHEKGWFHPLFMFLMLGVNFSLITGDLFNLFVAFEILLLSSYALMCLGASREQLRHAYKYVMLNLLGSTFFVLGAGLVYGLTGTLNFADLAAFVADANARGESLPPGFQAVSMVLLFVFALKAAVFPLWFWLPDTYHTCPIAICALFGGLLTKVGVYALFRIFPMAFAAPGLTDSGGFITIVSFAAGFSLIIAILGAIAMRSIRRLLALTLMSHIGYFAFGLALMTPDAMTGAIFYMVQHMVVMAALFLCCGAIEMYAGTDDLQKMGGLLNRAPWLAVLFFIAAVSLIGLPPTSGFYGKVLLLAEGFRAADRGFWILSLLGVITSILTLVAMGKVWTQAFWSPERVEAAPDHTWLTPAPRNLAPVYAGAVLLVIISITAAFAAEPLTRVSRLAADSLTQPRGYVAAVLGESAWPGALATEAPPEAQTTAVDVDQHHKGSAH